MSWARGFGGGAVALGLEGRSLLERILIMAPAVLVWLRWIVWPLHLSADYLPDVFVPNARLGLAQLAGFAVLGLAAWAAWAARRRQPGITVGIVFGAVTASVASNVVVPTGVLLAERLAYLPSVGAAIVVGALWEALPRSRYLWPATAGLLALLAARTLLRDPGVARPDPVRPGAVSRRSRVVPDPLGDGRRAPSLREPAAPGRARCSAPSASARAMPSCCRRWGSAIWMRACMRPPTGTCRRRTASTRCRAAPP